MKEPATILSQMYDFLLYLVPQLSKFPRDHKFMLGDRTQVLAHDILDDLISAYYTRMSNEKVEALRKANLKLERLRYCIRLSHDLKLFSDE
ncbi:four helix bundle protein [candidate division KSB1 bacterium]|nr:four helix bundle protein [candidate division KSB1 bacterium]